MYHGSDFADNPSKATVNGWDKLLKSWSGPLEGQAAKELAHRQFLDVVASQFEGAFAPDAGLRVIREGGQAVDFDEHIYKERYLVECFINKIKHYRRIFSRFEKLANRFLSFLSFVGALIWLR